MPSARPNCWPGSPPPGAVLVFHDVTDLRRMFEELRKSQERFELAVEGSRDGVWDWDLESNEIYFSLMGFKIYNLDQSATSWNPGR